MNIIQPLAVFPTVQDYIDDGGGLTEGTPVVVFGQRGTAVRRGLVQGANGAIAASPSDLFRDARRVDFLDLAVNDGLSVVSGSASVLSKDATGMLVSLDNDNSAIELKLDVFGSTWGLGMFGVALTPDPSATDVPTTNTRCAVYAQQEAGVDAGRYFGQEVYWSGAAWRTRFVYKTTGAETTSSDAAIGGVAPFLIGGYARGNGSTAAQNPLGFLQGNLPGIAAAPAGTTGVAWLTDTTDTTRVSSIRIQAQIDTPVAGKTATFRLRYALWLPAMGRNTP